MAFPSLCTNPHLRAEIMQVIYLILPRKKIARRYKRDYMEDFGMKVFSESKINNEFLMIGLIRIFIDSEKTGSSN